MNVWRRDNLSGEYVSFNVHPGVNCILRPKHNPQVRKANENWYSIHFINTSSVPMMKYEISRKRTTFHLINSHGEKIFRRLDTARKKLQFFNLLEYTDCLGIKIDDCLYRQYLDELAECVENNINWDDFHKKWNRY